MSGVNQAIWQLARAQRSSGDDVSVLTFTDGDDPSVPVVRTQWWRLPLTLHRLRPDVLHLHSVLRPEFVVATVAARLLGIPVVVSPHGGYAPAGIARRRGWKRWYENTVERTRIRLTTAFCALTEQECADVRRLYPAARVHVVPNVVEVPGRTFPGAGTASSFVFLGRPDVHTKGIDRIAALARMLPAADFSLYSDGAADLEIPGNVRWREPVDGHAKWDALADAGCYLQLSRWEAFGMSIVEAMLVGTPIAVSRECAIAGTVKAGRLGLVLTDADDPVATAAELRAYLGGPEALASACRARDWALAEVTPAAVTTRLNQVYGPTSVERPELSYSAH